MAVAPDETSGLSGVLQKQGLLMCLFFRQEVLRQWSRASQATFAFFSNLSSHLGLASIV